MVKRSNLDVAQYVAQELQQSLQLQPVLNYHCCVHPLRYIAKDLREFFQLILRIGIWFVLEDRDFSLLFEEVLDVHSLDLVISNFDFSLDVELVAIDQDVGLRFEVIDFADPHVQIVIVFILARKC